MAKDEDGFGWTVPLVLVGAATTLAVLFWPRQAVAEQPPTSTVPPPEPPPGAEGATSILARTAALSQDAREREFVALVERGNVPSWTWSAAPVRPGLAAMTDFLAVGSDDDFVWIPLTPRTAAAVLAAHGMRLPTRSEADAIFAAARSGGGFLPFQSFSPRHGQTRWGSDAISETRRRIEAERGGRRGLLDGHKKYVLGRAVVNGEGRVIIYGGHTQDGAQVQPCSTVHDESYLDYSHGIRGVRA